MREPRVEILYFEDCPNHGPVRVLVDRVAAALGLQPTIDVVEVTDAPEAAQLRFLGSPTIRVNGRDVEPGADSRSDFSMSCRIYRTASGVAGRPDEAWIRDALRDSVA